MPKRGQNGAEFAVKIPYEMLILASIVEETGQAHERDQIAGYSLIVLIKACVCNHPMVIYGMGERYRAISPVKDLVEETPFNTYRIFGLPPTPIAAPSKASLMAVSKPPVWSYLYFVSRNDGTHVFSH